MPTDFEQRLTATYRGMHTAQIERLLADQELAPAAMRIAQAELARRQAQPQRSRRKPPQGAGASAGSIAGTAVLVGLIAFALLPKEMFGMVLLLITIPTLLTVLGKAVPALGLALGWGLVILTPIAAFMLFGAASGTKDGTARVLAGIAAILLPLFCLGFGAALIRGAQHEESWDDLRDDLDEDRKRTADRLRRLD